MIHHERYLTLAARQLSEGLSRDEEAELDAHLATCRSCRGIAAGMRRDDILLRGELGAVAVAPRVRQRVLDEAYGRRRFDPRIVLALAATLLLATIGLPLIAGGLLRQAEPSPSEPAILSPDSSASATVSPSPGPSLSLAPSPSASSLPSLSAPPRASPGPGPFVAAHYTYNQAAPRRDTISARNPDDPVGEWTRTQPPVGGSVFAGPVTCLVIEGRDAWLAGPAEIVPPDRDWVVGAFVHLHDGGPDGEGDRAILWLNNRGETLTLLEGWCRDKFVPGGPYPLTSGDIVVGTDSP
jgi:hypothetical protein